MCSSLIYQRSSHSSQPIKTTIVIFVKTQIRVNSQKSRRQWGYRAIAPLSLGNDKETAPLHRFAKTYCFTMKERQVEVHTETNQGGASQEAWRVLVGSKHAKGIVIDQIA